MRFSMLETLREFALEQAETLEQQTALASRHLDYFLRLAETAEPELRRPAQAAYLCRLERDHDNLRAALAWGVEHDPRDRGLRLAAALTWFWLMHSHIEEGCGWLTRALETAPDAPPAVRAKALRGAGWLAWRVHDRENAVAHSESALALCREQGDTWGAAFCLNTLGLAMHHGGDRARALPLLEEGVALARPTNDGWLLGHSLYTRPARRCGKVLPPCAPTATSTASPKRCARWGTCSTPRTIRTRPGAVSRKASPCRASWVTSARRAART
jgi:non-specific serine/threonine protein kinase